MPPAYVLFAPLFRRPPFHARPRRTPSFRASRPQSMSAKPGTKVLPGLPSGANNLPNWVPTPMARSQELARLFQEPDSPAQRQYEVCRAYFCESTPADEIARRFHLHSNSVRTIVRDFARDPDVNVLFTSARTGPKTSPKRDAIHEQACELRRQGATLADIRAALGRQGLDVSPDYSHPFMQSSFDLIFAHRRITGVFGAHTAPFPVDDFSLLGRTRSSAPRVRRLRRRSTLRSRDDSLADCQEVVEMGPTCR